MSEESEVVIGFQMEVDFLIEPETFQTHTVSFLVDVPIDFDAIVADAEIQTRLLADLTTREKYPVAHVSPVSVWIGERGDTPEEIIQELEDEED